MFKGLVVGAYPASPAHRNWDAGAEEEFFAALVAIPGVGALELPWLGGLHPHDEAWLLANFPAEFHAIMNGIPHTMGRIGASPIYGLASRAEDGRLAAIADLARLRDDVRRFNDAQGRSVVDVVELHTAPRGVAGAVEPLIRSLSEVAAWDWDGSQLVIQHCDAWRDSQTPEKGFLELEAEMDAIESSGAPVGISLNWGRSAIEGRSADAVVEHARAGRERGLLRGFIASGAADVDTAYGPAWVDAHLPFAASAMTEYGLAGSAMTEKDVADVLRAAGALDWCGVKVGAVADASLASRIALVAESVAQLVRIQESLV